MAYIEVEDGLPGIMGLLEYRLDTAEPIRELTHILLRGPSSLTEGERELIAALVSSRNECRFCTTAHTAAADLLWNDHETSATVKRDYQSAPVSDKMKALLGIAASVQINGNEVTEEQIRKAKDLGATDLEIHDTVLITALFCLYNKYVDGLNAWTPDDPDFYATLAGRIVNRGYMRPPGGYANHKYYGKEK